MPVALFLVGPTASGKTSVAHELARRRCFSLVSADAMMIYRGMDIGTAKPTRDERVQYAYQGIDLVDPDQSFNALSYLRSVLAAPPALIVGGTGLYVRALLHGLDASAGARPDIRDEAGSIWREHGLDALKSWCRSRAPGIEEALPAGDLGNPRRWIRMVERMAGGGEAVAGLFDPAASVIVGLRRDREDLQRRIAARVDGMFAGGLLEEVRALRATYPSFSETAGKAIGYAEASAVIDGTMPLAVAREAVIIRTRQYAKRQMTWFRHQLPTRWVDVAADDSDELIASRVEKLLHG